MNQDYKIKAEIFDVNKGRFVPVVERPLIVCGTPNLVAPLMGVDRASGDDELAFAHVERQPDGSMIVVDVRTGYEAALGPRLQRFVDDVNLELTAHRMAPKRKHVYRELGGYSIPADWQARGRRTTFWGLFIIMTAIYVAVKVWWPA